jgi:hypothetical protein
MVAVGAQRAILGAADSALLHLPIFNRRSPCMMHNLPNNPDEHDQSGSEMAQEASKRMKFLWMSWESLCPCSC